MHYFSLGLVAWSNHTYICMEECINPLVPKFKIPTEPINAGDKRAAPKRQPISVHITPSSAFLQSKWLQKGFSYV